MTKTNPHQTRTVVVLGSAYGGIGAVGPLAKRLPEGWKLVVIDRQTHANRERGVECDH
jgi:NADH dehydrogenase FAD-containing subunit